MKEQVKEWIVDKNLTTDSFDSIMIGVIYNSGHSTLDDPDVRKWIETHPSEFRGMLPPKLTDDQQVVLEWLKEQVSIGNDLQYVLWEFTDNVYEEPAEYSVSEQTKAWLELTEQEQFQVLAAFAEWGMEQEKE